MSGGGGRKTGLNAGLFFPGDQEEGSSFFLFSGYAAAALTSELLIGRPASCGSGSAPFKGSSLSFFFKYLTLFLDSAAFASSDSPLRLTGAGLLSGS